MVIEAKFSSVCPNCSIRIQPRENVEWTKGNPATHLVCPTTAHFEQRSGYQPVMVAASRDADDASYDAWMAFQTMLAECGVYVLPSSDIVRIKTNAEKTGSYAMAWQHISGYRLTEEIDPETLKNNRSQGDYQYAPQLKSVALSEGRKMSRDEALRFSTLYGICAWCGRRLKAADSVARGIGPVCILRFPEGTTAADLMAAPVSQDRQDAPVMPTVAQDNAAEVAYDNGAESVVFKGSRDYDIAAWLARKGFTK
jgi:hypothetical protein